jgi:hypothetical protein
MNHLIIKLSFKRSNSPNSIKFEEGCFGTTLWVSKENIKLKISDHSTRKIEEEGLCNFMQDGSVLILQKDFSKIWDWNVKSIEMI